MGAQGKILTAAVSPDPDRADVGYDVPRIFNAMDFVSIMNYDYHGAWDNFTGHNTPLYGRSGEGNTGHPQFNVNDTLRCTIIWTMKPPNRRLTLEQLHMAEDGLYPQ